MITLFQITGSSSFAARAALDIIGIRIAGRGSDGRSVLCTRRRGRQLDDAIFRPWRHRAPFGRGPLRG